MADEPMSDHDDADEHQPRGTLLIMIALLLAIIGTWVYTYSILLGRA